MTLYIAINYPPIPRTSRTGRRESDMNAILKLMFVVGVAFVLLPRFQGRVKSNLYNYAG